MLKDIWYVLTGRLSSNLLKESLSLASTLDKQAISLSQQLHSFDEQLFMAVQHSEPKEICKALGPLVDKMMARKNAESKRITDILTPQLEKIYGRPY